MVQRKKLLFSCFFMVFLACLMVGVFANTNNLSANAQTLEESTTYDENIVEPRGLTTNLALSIGGDGNGEVWARVKNEFTLFSSTIQVYIELYSSETYQESYSTMTLEKRDYIADLDMGEILKISVPTRGKQKYWQARMRYKFDNRDWVAKVTSTLLYSADGVCIK